MKTLKEVTQIVGMTRRVIQEYEKAGIAKTPTKVNKYGHLLYDEKAIEHLWQIRFYRELGYDKKQMKKIFFNKNYNKQEALKLQIEELERKKQELDTLIKVAKSISELEISISVLPFTVPILKDIPYDMITPILAESLYQAPSDELTDSEFNFELSENSWKEITHCFVNITRSFKKNIAINDDTVQTYVKKIHNSLVATISDSIIIFSMFNAVFSSDEEFTRDLDENIGEGCSEYIFKAIKCYCENYVDNPTDNKLFNAFNNIEMLEKNNFCAESYEVQHEVEAIHEFLKSIPILSPNLRIKILHHFSEFFDKNIFVKQKNGDYRKTNDSFTSQAIQIYCAKLEA